MQIWLLEWRLPLSLQWFSTLFSCDFLSIKEIWAKPSWAERVNAYPVVETWVTLGLTGLSCLFFGT